MPFRKMTRMPSQEVETLQEGAVLLDTYNAATVLQGNAAVQRLVHRMT